MEIQGSEMKLSVVLNVNTEGLKTLLSKAKGEKGIIPPNLWRKIAIFITVFFVKELIFCG